tara:strand:+ start:1001 stop:1252 length:252 start_codon:yes stop_codon:yes gene_type:complete
MNIKKINKDTYKITIPGYDIYIIRCHDLEHIVYVTDVFDVNIDDDDKAIIDSNDFDELFQVEDFLTYNYNIDQKIINKIKWRS